MFSDLPIFVCKKSIISARKLAHWSFLTFLSLGLICQYSWSQAYASPVEHKTVAHSNNTTHTDSKPHSFFQALSHLLSFHQAPHVTAAHASTTSPKTAVAPVPKTDVFANSKLVLHTIAHYIGLVFGPYSYKPSPELLTKSKSEGKTPVIILHGTWANANWMSDIVQSLDKAGIPAYAPTVGTGGLSLSGTLPFLGMVQPAAYTEKQVAAYIAQVEKETGASKVDLIGHSQGGLLIKDYIAHDTKNDVQAVVDLGATEHGTTLDGFAKTLYNYSKPVQKVITGTLATVFGQGIFDQLIKSKFVQHEDQYPDTKPGINYLVLASRDDLTSTPYWNTFLKAGPGANVSNVEVHSLPGVTGSISHSQLPITPGVVDAITHFIETQGEPATQTLSTKSISNGAAGSQQVVSAAPQVSLLG